MGGKRGGAEVRGESGVCGGGNLVPLVSPKARFKFCCMRLRIRASLGEATWLHPFPPAMKRRQIRASLGEATRLHAFPPLHEATNSRQPWRGDMATSFSASHGRQFRASLGEATRLYAFPPAMEATNSALALERLPKKVTLGRLLERCVD